MTKEQRLHAIAEGHLAGTIFKLGERLGIPWRRLRTLTMKDLLERL
jgi:hypothetical protein